MQKIFRILITSFFAVAAVTLMACATPPAEENQNADRAARSEQQSNSSAPKVLREGNPQVEGSGDIEVNSDPPGAQVLLIEEDDGGSSPPKPYGVTPTKITGLAAGKYTVHLEKPGYKYYQKFVKVVPNQTAKVKTKLKKE